MKKLVLLLFLISTAFVSAQNINGRISSSLYGFQRFYSETSSENYLRAYEMLNLNFNYKKFSLKSYLNYETDVTTKMKSDPRLRFYNLYVEGRNLFDVATFRLGRQPFINNVAGGIYDGASLTIKNKKIKFNAYVGGSVPAYQKLETINNFSDNMIFGGKFVTTFLQNFQFSLGYVNKNVRPDSYVAEREDTLLNPIEVLIANKSNQYQFISADVNYAKKSLLSIYSRADYDVNYNMLSKFELDANIDALKDWSFNFYGNYRQPKIRYNSIFAVFDYGNTYEVEVGADYKINKNFTVTGKFGDVEYKTDNSQRIGIGVFTNFGTLNYRKTFGYAGELDAISIYSAYTFFDGLLTPSVGLSYTSYKITKESDTNHLTTLLFGTNVRPVRAFSVDVQGQYMDNKIYKNDFRFFLKLNYWFNLNL